MFNFFRKKSKETIREEKPREEKPREEKPAAAAGSGAAKKDSEPVGFSNLDTDAMFEMIRKLHENADKNYNLGDVGLTEDEKKAIALAIDQFKGSPLLSTLVSPANLSKAGLAVQYEMTCDATLYGIIDTCIESSLGLAKNETLEKALKKLRDYQP